VAILSDARPLPGLDLGEVMGIADVPGGVVNLLSGRRSELAPALASHHALNAIVNASGELEPEIDKLAAESVTRVRHAAASTDYATATADPLSRLEALTELKTAWHPSAPSAFCSAGRPSRRANRRSSISSRSRRTPSGSDAVPPPDDRRRDYQLQLVHEAGTQCGGRETRPPTVHVAVGRFLQRPHLVRVEFPLRARALGRHGVERARVHHLVGATPHVREVARDIRQSRRAPPADPTRA
jgi:hypothetical protein